MDDSISSFFEDQDFRDPSFSGFPTSPEDLFSIFDALEGLKDATTTTTTTTSGGGDEDATRKSFMFQDLCESDELDALEAELGDNELLPKSKRAKIATSEEKEIGQEGSKVSHITVERNRRKQMNDHLSVLRSLMPCFYVKRGDQASIIGGVVDYINELQQLLQSLEAKKQRKVYSDVLSPRVISSPRPSPQVLSPRKPPLSPRLNLPISPRTPQPSSPYRPRLISPTMSTPIDLSPTPSSSSSSLNDSANELVANSRSPVAEVEVKFSGPNLLLKTVSPRIPGQVVKIISTLEDLSLEILDINIITMEDTMLNSFTIKIGIECQLSAEELAHQIQQTFCSFPLLN
ncbi:transcription factor SPEECHLESS [Beta vulgaris subsp. vulgaris]|uniref:transcription factor SPEECHLESS n=1 Tax=Beta vulgaris subsp. vulgaris TaxID=3555 RepID=UPI002036E9F7|nr:transcription factor SPEECHLESS [Beta vulgaris subsp. vulgaris]